MSSKLHIALALIPLLGTTACDLSRSSGGYASSADVSEAPTQEGGSGALSAALSQNQIRLMNGTAKVCGNAVDEISRIQAVDSADYKSQLSALLASKSAECRGTFNEAVEAAAPLVASTQRSLGEYAMSFLVPSAHASEPFVAGLTVAKVSAVFSVIMAACVKANMPLELAVARASAFKDEIMAKTAI